MRIDRVGGVRGECEGCGRGVEMARDLLAPVRKVVLGLGRGQRLSQVADALGRMGVEAAV